MDFKFPDVGEGIHEGVIVSWNVKEGDEVKRDDVLCEVETDKAVVEIPSPEHGIIKKLYHAVGETVTVGENLVSYQSDSEGTEPAEEAPTEEKAPASTNVVGSMEDADTSGKPSGPLFDSLKKREHVAAPTESKEIRILPAIRKLAEKLGVDLATVTGTGPGGKITKEDIEKAGADTSAAPSKAPAPNMNGLSPMRKAIWKHLQKTKDAMIPVSQTHHIDITALAAHRKKRNEELVPQGVKLTFLPFIFKAMVTAVKEYPSFNAEFDEVKGEFITHDAVHMGVAVDSPDGLFVPVISDAHTKDVVELATELKELAAGVQDGSIDKKKLSGSTITLTNYGSLGSVYGTPIINYPNTCIIGVGSFLKQPALVDGALVEKLILPLTVTYDHRFNDGADAARFMSAIGAALETEDSFTTW